MLRPNLELLIDTILEVPETNSPKMPMTLWRSSRTVHRVGLMMLGKKSCPHRLKLVKKEPSRSKQRYRGMDKCKFWHLKSGRDVETVLFEASLGGAATFRIRSYTIDYDCPLTRALFTNEEWSELCEQRAFDVPDLCKTTEQYLVSLRKALNRGDHVTTVPIPKTDVIACELALLSIIQWTQIYKANPSPFDNITETSEAFWCREGWPLLRRILETLMGLR
ncbi:hypothetical protein BC939DRAFT_92178 [Gamsiella multidivaricata]|uniref:uncharacterized protein n=1 Tax=Gamsiella multidivaricata TaxID=101098 RepID=UPI00221F9AA5|nr:uncharacterized protein BC939DRAFT_92178 [Gamsiella multidivaricata]KAI7815747.1 hypothetical protein BC939DRAFT_92178 [Gamsiella multidivaricata]